MSTRAAAATERGGGPALAAATAAESEKLTLLHTAVSRLESIIATLGTPLTARSTGTTPLPSVVAHLAEPNGARTALHDAQSVDERTTTSDGSTAVRPQPRPAIPSPVISPSSSISDSTKSVLDSPTSVQRSTLAEAHTLSAMAPRQPGAHTSPQCVGCAPEQRAATDSRNSQQSDGTLKMSTGTHIRPAAQVAEVPPLAYWPPAVHTAEESHRALHKALTDPVSGAAFGLYTNMQPLMLKAAAYASEAAAAVQPPPVGLDEHTNTRLRAATPPRAATEPKAKMRTTDISTKPVLGAPVHGAVISDRPTHLITEELPARGYDGLVLRARARDARALGIDAERANPTGWVCSVPGCPCSSIVRGDSAAKVRPFARILPDASVACTLCACSCSVPSCSTVRALVLPQAPIHTFDIPLLSGSCIGPPIALNAALRTKPPSVTHLPDISPTAPTAAYDTPSAHARTRA
jgi:hypothetical protein